MQRLVRALLRIIAVRTLEGTAWLVSGEELAAIGVPIDKVSFSIVTCDVSYKRHLWSCSLNLRHAVYSLSA